MAEYKMLWKPQMEMDFIDLIHEKRFMWDKKDGLYSKKGLKRQEYENIAEKLRETYPFHYDLFDWELLMKKFNGFKSRFKSELSKIKDLKSRRPDINNIPKWQYFDRLQFLMNNCTDEESVSNPNDPNISQNSDASNEEQEYSITAYTSNVFPQEEIESEDDISQLEPQSSQREPQSSQREPQSSRGPQSPPQSDPQSSQRDPQSLQRDHPQSPQRDPQSPQRDPQSPQRDPQSPQREPQSSQRMTDVENQAETTDHISKRRKHWHYNSFEAMDIEESFAHFVAMYLRDFKDPRAKKNAMLDVQRVLLKREFGTNLD